MILIFDYFETIALTKVMDFNCGLKSMWENITKINVRLKRFQHMEKNCMGRCRNYINRA